jgi:hypothetical protein
MKHVEVLIVARLLRRAFVNVDGGGWRWKGGYNDERVALECGIKGITAGHVTRLRRAAFGDAPKPSHRSVLAAVVERSKALERQITTLMQVANPPLCRSRLH